MSYRAVVVPPLARKIARWGLSDALLVDVWLYLREILPTSPSSFLRRVRQPVDGMVFEFKLIDPENRLREYQFVFLVFYGQDEQSLFIAQGSYSRREGF